MPYLPWNAPYLNNDSAAVTHPALSQGTEAFPVAYAPKGYNLRTTLDPYNINMYLEYGPISVYNDDRTLDVDERETFQGWYFRPKIDGATISLFNDEIIVMYVQIENPIAPGEFESWSCSTSYEMKDTVYVGQVYNYNYGTERLNNDAMERDSYTVDEQTRRHPEYTRNGPWFAADALEWYT